MFSKNLKTERKKHNFRFSFGRFLIMLYLIMFLVIILFPLIWMFSLSFKEPKEVTEAYFYLIPKNFRFDNYARALEFADTRHLSIQNMYKNSIIITFSSVAVTIVIGIFASYALSRLKFKGRNIYFYLFLIGMIIPLQVVLIPVFILTKYLGLLHNYLSLILPYIAYGLPISIFILRGFFSQIPKDICEAAKIDGASEFTVLLRIILPISKPAIATCVIFLFLQNWNEFVLALVLLVKVKLYTIPLALSKFQGEFQFPVELYSAAIFMTAIPIIVVFIIFQNWFVKGLTAGAIKG